MSSRYHGVTPALLALIAQGHRPRAYYLPQRLMVAYTTLGNGSLPHWHVVCTKVTHDLWLQLTSVLRLARARTFHQAVCPQSTRPTPQRWSIHKLLIPMPLRDRMTSLLDTVFPP